MHIRRSSGDRWSSWSGRAATRKSCRGSLSRRRRQSWVDEGRRADGLTTAERQELGRLRREKRQIRIEREILKLRPGSRGRRVRTYRRLVGARGSVRAPLLRRRRDRRTARSIGRVIIPTAPVPERPSIPCPANTHHRSLRTRVRWPDPSVVLVVHDHSEELDGPDFGVEVGAKEKRKREPTAAGRTRHPVWRRGIPPARHPIQRMLHRKVPGMGGAAIQRDRDFTCGPLASSCFRDRQDPVVRMLSDRKTPRSPARGTARRDLPKRGTVLHSRVFVEEPLNPGSKSAPVKIPFMSKLILYTRKKFLASSGNTK